MNTQVESVACVHKLSSLTTVGLHLLLTTWLRLSGKAELNAGRQHNLKYGRSQSTNSIPTFTRPSALKTYNCIQLSLKNHITSHLDLFVDVRLLKILKPLSKPKIT